MKKTLYNTQQRLERYSKLSKGIKMPLNVAAGATLLTAALSPTDLLQAQCLGLALNSSTLDVDGDNVADVTFNAPSFVTYYGSISYKLRVLMTLVFCLPLTEG